MSPLRWQVKYRSGATVREPDNYHALIRDEVRSLCLINNVEKVVWGFYVPEGATFFHRRRGLVRPGRHVEVRLIGYWLGPTLEVWFVTEAGHVEHRTKLEGEHAVYGNIDMLNEEKADRVRRNGQG